MDYHNRRMTVRVLDLASNGVAFSDGDRLYKLVSAAVSKNELVVLNFAGIRVFASPFFNGAVARFFKDLTPEEFRGRVEIQNLAAQGEAVLARVIENSRKFYRNPEAIRALDKLLEESRTPD